MMQHPPSTFEMLLAVMWLILLVLVCRFVLRRFVGVSRLQRRQDEQRRLLEALAKRLNVELPAELAEAPSMKARVCAAAHNA